MTLFLMQLVVKNYKLNAIKLAIAKQNNIKSIAFPLISSGIYGYPKDKAIRVAIGAISEFLLENDIMVYLVVFDRKAFQLSEKLFSSIKKYIDEKYVYEKNEIDKYRTIQNYEFVEQKSAEYFCNEFIPKSSVNGRRKIVSWNI